MSNREGGFAWRALTVSAAFVVLAATAAVAAGGAQDHGAVKLRTIGSDTARGVSDAVVVDDGALVHTALLFPDTATGEQAPSADAGAQVASVLRTLERVLAAAGADARGLVRLHVYVADASVTTAVDGELARRFAGGHAPAVTLVESRMPRAGALVAMDAIAATSRRPPSGTPLRLVVDGVPPTTAGGAHLAVQPDGPFVVVSGRAAPGAFEAAVTGTMEQLRGDLAGVGLDFSHVLQVKTFLGDMTKAADAQRLVAAVFDGTPPPQVVTEWRDAGQPVEIELLAAMPSSPSGTPALTYVEPIASRFSRLARVAGGRPVFVSGLTGADADPVAQVREIYEHLARVLAEAGSDMRHLVKATYYVSDAGADREINEIRPTVYDEARPPAASKISVTGVGRQGRGVTIDMLAVTRER